MSLRTLEQTDVTGKTVLYRSPYDIGVVEGNGAYKLVDDSRIQATLPTLRYLLKQSCRVVILTYVGRPDGQVVESLRTTPHARRLAELLDHPVQKLDDCVGEQVQKHIDQMEPGEIVMLENVRFHPGEVTDDDDFAQELAQNGEIVVYDGFPQSHRFHASTTGILRHLPSCVGLYFELELTALSGLLKAPSRPFSVIIGGAKISDKVGAIENLYSVADIFLVGGGVGNVFLKAKGYDIGDSYIEDVYVDENKQLKQDWVELARDILAKGKDEGRQRERLFQIGSEVSLDKIQTPSDFILAHIQDEASATQKVDLQTGIPIPPDWAILDIGPQTAQIFAHVISKSKTIFWNGPMGKFEDERFIDGSRRIVQAMSETIGETIIAGGDTISVAKKYADLGEFTYISLAGGATLEYLAGKPLPVLELLGG